MIAVCCSLPACFHLYWNLLLAVVAVVVAALRCDAIVAIDFRCPDVTRATLVTYSYTAKVAQESRGTATASMG